LGGKKLGDREGELLFQGTVVFSWIGQQKVYPLRNEKPLGGVGSTLREKKRRSKTRRGPYLEGEGRLSTKRMNPPPEPSKKRDKR